MVTILQEGFGILIVVVANQNFKHEQFSIMKFLFPLYTSGKKSKFQKYFLPKDSITAYVKNIQYQISLYRIFLFEPKNYVEKI